MMQWPSEVTKHCDRHHIFLWMPSNFAEIDLYFLSNLRVKMLNTKNSTSKKNTIFHNPLRGRSGWQVTPLTHPSWIHHWLYILMLMWYCYLDWCYYPYWKVKLRSNIQDFGLNPHQESTCFIWSLKEFCCHWNLLSG